MRLLLTAPDRTQSHGWAPKEDDDDDDGDLRSGDGGGSSSDAVVASFEMLHVASSHADYLDALSVLVQPSMAVIQPTAAATTATTAAIAAFSAEAEALLASKPLPVLARIAEMLHQILHSAVLRHAAER